MTDRYDADAAHDDYIREAYGDPCPGCGTLRWQADCPKCYREDEEPALPPVAEVLCAVCRKPVTIGHPDTVDHFVYEFDGELDYIELLHRACAESRGYVLDAEGHSGKRPDPAAPLAVTLLTEIRNGAAPAILTGQTIHELLEAEQATAGYEAWLAALEAEDLTEREQAFFYHLSFNGRR